MAQEMFHLTPSGYNKLKQKLAGLIEVDLREANEQIQEMKTEQQSEDAIFFDVMVEKERIEEKIQYLENVISNANIMTQDENPELVSPGNRVIAYDMDEKEDIEMDLIGSAEKALGLDGVSVKSPVGQALLGHKVGDKVEVEVPMGKVRFKIKKILMIPYDEE
ncbi:transcription elongation factor GreA [Anaerolineales bacterium]